MFQEYESLLRTTQSYDEEVLMNDFQRTGIKEKCIFNDINNFHICENPSVDVMHDLSEGIACYTIAEILEVLIRNKDITLSVVNNRIEAFQYGQFEIGNKPRPIYFTQGKKGGEKIKLKQSSAEMLCLARYLGLIIGDLIPPDNKYWKLYLILRKIISVLTSPSLTKGVMLNVAELIQKHNQMYFSFFGKLKPKMHLWIHYPRIMILNGPVIHYATNKFERKNKKLKETAVGVTSTMNLPLTITIKHQLQSCYAMKFSPPIQQDTILGLVLDKNVQINELKILFLTMSDDALVTIFKNIDILGKTFSAGTIFVTNIDQTGPCFGKLKRIFSYENCVYLQAEQFETLYFNHYYYAYNVMSNVDKPDVIINIDAILRTSPCIYVHKNQEEFIASRYDL